MAVAIATKKWTLEELHRLPDDGNKYELIHGELFVTPAPTYVHETIIARLLEVLVPYVMAQRLGYVHVPRAVVRQTGSEVEPDVQVRRYAAGVRNDWENVPTPHLVVEVLSDSTRRRDFDQKRRFYLEDVRIPEYWMVDPETRTVRVAKSAAQDDVVSDALTWAPDGAGEPLVFEVSRLFDAPQ